MRKPSSSSSQKQNSKSKNTSDFKKKNKKRKQYVPISFLDCQSLTHVVGFPPQNELVTTPTASEFVKELFLDRFVKEIVRPFQPSKTPKNENSQDNPAGSQPFATAETNAGYYHVMVGGKLVKKRRISSEKTANRSSSKGIPPTNTIDNGKLATKRKIWKENIVIGSNRCLRLLEAADAHHCKNDDNETQKFARSSNIHAIQNPSLIVMAKDVYPPTMLCAAPVLAKRLKIPLLLLPGKASLDLGKALNMKRISIIIFCCGDESAQTNGTINSENGENEISSARAAIASFVSFVLEQLDGQSN